MGQTAVCGVLHRIDRSGLTVAGVAAPIEQRIAADVVPSPKTIVEIDPGPWSVEEEVADDRGLHRLALKPCRPVPTTMSAGRMR